MQIFSAGLLAGPFDLPGGGNANEVVLNLECKVENGLLHVRYVLANRGKLPILAYDGAPGQPASAPWPDLKAAVYASIVGDTLALKRINPPPLPGVNMEAAFLPALTETLPGERREVRFSLSEPIAERSQYTPDFPGAVYRERIVPTVQLHIGYFARTEAMQLVPFPANPKAYRLKGAHGPQSLVTASVMRPLRVKERTDSKFQRI